MKSAYELAMERLREAEPAPARTLTGEEKLALEEIDRRYRAKIAEKEVFLEKQRRDALTKGDAKEAEAVALQLTREKARLAEEREEEKERIRHQAG